MREKKNEILGIKKKKTGEVNQQDIIRWCFFKSLLFWCRGNGKHPKKSEKNKEAAGKKITCTERKRRKYNI